MAGKEDNRIFVGGLSWDVTERQLENAFARYGKIVESQIMLERDTGRPRGFGFITFADHRGMDEAIREMHGRELGDRVISVNKAQPKMGDDLDRGYRGGYSTGGRSYGGGDRNVGQDDCFKCGRPGHWARDCPSAGAGRGRGGSSFSPRSRFGGVGGHAARFGGERDRYMDDRYDGGRYGDRERFDSRDNKYESRERYASDRFPVSGDHFADRYGGSERFPQNGYGKDRGYDRYGGTRGGTERYGTGGVPTHDEGRGYRSRAGPYDRPNRGGRPSSFDRY
ncbi:putative Glycine-rich RNA-binding protein [Quillaja saponaria]|uniref:Glycine-rich RNA-binding protein n=1 Tax=Quillaja saponaria TaxID=32244 RepID=A0AAD7Q506_QUISA|nr:putative Glycine-rich RNA-binding protein [Quillaja saponaria]